MPPHRDESSFEETRMRAYHLWQQAGSPSGRDFHFWLQAERELFGDLREQIKPAAKSGDPKQSAVSPKAAAKRATAPASNGSEKRQSRTAKKTARAR